MSQCSDLRLKLLTLDGELYVRREGLSSHLVGRGTAVHGVVVGRLDGEYQLVLRSTAPADVREVEFGAVAVPVDLRQRVAASRHADQASRVARLQHLFARVARDLRLTWRIYSHTTYLTYYFKFMHGLLGLPANMGARKNFFKGVGGKVQYLFPSFSTLPFFPSFSSPLPSSLSTAPCPLFLATMRPP